MKFSIQRLNFLILFIYIFLSNCFSQNNEISFRHITVEEGLSQSSVMSIVQDKKGFMWFGTQEGLNKFDGYKFVVYKNNPEDANSMSGNRVWTIIEDHLGYLWIGTNGSGLNRFNPETEEFTRYQNNPDDSASISDDRLYDILEDHNGAIWIATDAGLNQFDRTTEKFIKYKHNSKDATSISSNYINSVFEDSQHNLWISTDGGGLNLFNRDSRTFTHFKHDPKNSASISSNYVWEICEDKTGDLWIGTANGLNQFNKITNNFIHYFKENGNPNSLSDNFISNILRDSFGNLWLGTQRGGICKLTIGVKDDKNFTRFPVDRNSNSSFNDNLVVEIYEDRSGLLWFGAWDGGINQLDLTRKEFNILRHNPSNQNSISHYSVFGIHEDRKGNIWIGTSGGGLDCYNPLNNKYTNYMNSPQNFNSLSNNDVWHIFEDQAGIVWIGTSYGLNRFDVKNNRFIRYLHSPQNENSISNNVVYQIIEDSFEKFWIGTYDGLNLFDYSKKKFTRYLNDQDDPNSISGNMVITLFKDQLGIIWIGTNNGLNRFNLISNSFTVYKNNPLDKLSISSNRIQSIYEDSNGILWIGTTKGLNRFDRTKEIFERFSEKDGLPNNVIYDILEDKNSNLWLSTNYGLSTFNPRNKTFINYDASDGLQSNEFNTSACAKSSDGCMYFGGKNGITSFYPDSIHSNVIIPNIVITDFKIFNNSVPVGKMKDGRTILTKSINVTNKIELSYNDYVLLFEYSALHYNYPQKNQYAYMMEGLEKDWNMVGNRRFASYSNLSPGNYIFRVKGSNNDNIWNHVGTSINITIIPPFWQTWWFHFIIFISIITGIYTIHQIRTRTIKRRNKELKNINLQLKNQISERKRLENALRQSEESFRSLAENAFDGIIILLDKRDYVYANPRSAQITGYGINELQNISFKKLFPDKEIKKALDILKQNIKKEALKRAHNLNLIQKNGKIIPIEVAMTNTIWQGKEAVIIFFRDIADRKRMEGEIQRIQKLESIGMLAGGIAHDFNNRISIILGNAQVAKMISQQGGDITKYLQNIEEGTEQAKALTQQLLTFSKGGVPIKKPALIKEVLEKATEFSLSGSNVKCEFDIPEDIWVVEIDSGQIDQVIGNIVINADQAMPDGGIVNITVENIRISRGTKLPLEKGRYVKIAIKDTGIGIHEKHLGKIFDPYFTTKIKGSGIGLATAYSIIKNHDGLITAKSEVGVGTRIIIYLPASDKKVIKDKVTEFKPGTGAGKILVMDDEELVREMAGDMLLSLGYEVEFAKDGIEAIKIYEKSLGAEKPFNAILMDLTIPGSMGGKKAIKQLLKINPNVKVIVSSGYSNDPIMADYKKYGFSGIIAKPYKIKELNDVLNKVL